MSPSGGKRKGAGRPPSTKLKVWFTIDRELAKWLKLFTPKARNELLEEAIVREVRRRQKKNRS